MYNIYILTSVTVESKVNTPVPVSCWAISLQDMYTTTPKKSEFLNVHDLICRGTSTT